MHFLEQKYKLDKNGTESKMKNPTDSFRGTKLVLQLIEELQIKSKTAMSWRSRKKKENIFVTKNLSEGFFLTFVFYLNL